MTVQDWVTSADPSTMRERSHGHATPRKHQLLACACVRRLWHLLDDSRSRAAVHVAERFAEGGATDRELIAAVRSARVAAGKLTRLAWAAVIGHEAAERAGRVVGGLAMVVDPLTADRAGAAAAADPRSNAAWAAQLAACCGFAHRRQPSSSAHYAAIAARFAALAAADPNHERAAQAALVSEILGVPGELTAFDPDWRTDEVLRLARAAEGGCGSLHDLGDALRDAGCDSHPLLSHCLTAGPHPRGCWVIDLALGRE